ncbi:hypothetical protein EG329_000441 [Mollisiaceae sp. DMI_Dod_QoI]|nr:hypothetical protein EG329_000441 [Helotiales sp. DMI_Dod_QoI]
MSKRVAPNPITERKRAAKSSKPLKAIFRGKFISSVGRFENCGKDLGPDDIAKYVIAHGGTYERQVTESTTHLICSIEEYKKKHPQVQAAWKLGKRKCNIVVFDWLLDCTVNKHKSCRAAAGYTLDRTIKRIRKGKTDHAEYRRKFEEGVKESKDLCDNRLYHIYYDHTGFEYKVMLTRINLGSHSDKPMVEKYTLYLFESHALPRLYMFGAKLSRTHRPTSYYREECHAMEFRDAFKHFQKWFKVKTGVDWDLRLEMKLRARDEVQDLSNREVARKFNWTPPVLGRPVGQLPWGYVRPEEREDTATSSSGDDSKGSKSSSSSNESTNGEEGSGSGSNEDVVYDTDSDVDSDEEEEEEEDGKDDDMNDKHRSHSSRLGISIFSSGNASQVGFSTSGQSERTEFIDLTED